MTRQRRPTGDAGTVLVLVLGLAGILVALVAVVVDVSAAVLAKRAVASAADGAALSAAQAVDLDVVYVGGLGEAVPLSVAEARRRVAAYETEARRQQPGLVLAVRVEGQTAVVTGTRSVRLPLRLPGSSPVRVTAVARARAPVAP